MPLSSSDIAQMIGGYQQMAMGQMQYAGMIGRYGMQQGQSQYGQPADMMMGRAMNAGMAVGAPVATMGMGLMGLDAMSMGMAGASMGWRAGGLMGAVGGGMAAAAIPMAATAAVSYGASQMMEGAHQQQLINQTLRTNFNQIGQYGRGFQRQEMTQIGQMMRGMTHEFGAGGEITTMNELTNLAGKMGQMGGGRGLQDVQEFGRRFKELVSTVKTVAQELGTSLESAQNMMQGLKGSGVFSKGNQMAAFKMAKGAALGGNLAMEEVMGMGNMGSQIARSIGGRGRAGFTAGVKTAGFLGGALETGVLSEEDIYNATGQVGAEGREALGASLMSVNASFLRSSRGRRVVASMAGRDGGLNEGDMESYGASGGFDTGGTMSRAYRNAHKVGRANFVRNEGKLRGEALAADPLIGVRQTMSWLESRGIDMNSDLGRIALQKQLKVGGANVGEEQLDALVKMVQNGDVIADHQKGRIAQDKTMQEIGNIQKTTGLAGMKTKLEHARESVQGKLQQAGAEFMNEGAEQIERLINALSDQYVQTYSRSVDEAFRKGAGGSAAGKQKYMELTGRTSLMGDSADLGQKIAQSRFGNTGGSEAATKSDMKRYEELGYRAGDKSDIERADRMAYAANTRVDDELTAYGAQNKDAIRRAFINGDIGGKGDARVTSVNRFLDDRDQLRLTGASNKYGSYDETDAVRVSSLLAGAGIADHGLSTPGGREGLMGGMGSTTAQRQEMLGRGMADAEKEGPGLFGYVSGAADRLGMGGMKAGAEGWGELLHGVTGKSVAGFLGSAAGKASEFLGATGQGGLAIGAGIAGSFLGNVANTASGAERAAGAFLESEGGKSTALGMLSRDEKRRKAAYEENMDRLTEMVAGGDQEHWDDAKKGEFGARKSFMMAHDVAKVMEESGGSLETAISQVAQTTGETQDRISNAYNAVRGGLAKMGAEARAQHVSALKKEGREALSAMQSRGQIEMNDDGSVMISMGAKKAADEYDRTNKGGRMKEMLDAMAAVEFAKSKGDDKGALEQSDIVSEIQDGMTVEQKRAAAKLQRSRGGGMGANELERKASIHDRFNKISSQYGAASGAAAILGVDMSDEDRAALKGMESGQQAEYILQKGGINLDTQTGQQLHEQLRAAMDPNAKGRDGKSLSSGERASRLASISGEVQREGAKEKEKQKEADYDKMGTSVGAGVAKALGGMTLKVTSATGDPVKVPA